MTFSLYFYLLTTENLYDPIDLSIIKRTFLSILSTLAINPLIRLNISEKK